MAKLSTMFVMVNAICLPAVDLKHETSSLHKRKRIEGKAGEKNER